VNERALIRAIQRYTATTRRDDNLIAGIGDDCAILRPRRGEDLLFTTDFVIEDVHFRRAQESGVETGYRALARGLSDIAAMGGEPRYALISLALSPWACENYVRDLYRGFAKLTERFNVQIIGGDVTRTEKLTIDVVVIGAVPRGKALRRSGARVGDRIYVSGPLGGAAAGGYKQRPEPRVELGQQLRGKATACMDLSDGLALDLHRLCVESGVAAALAGPIPTARRATLAQALSGGEDYELLCTIPPRRKAPAGLIAIGVITLGKPGALTVDGQPLEPKGWDPI
jgi:thiamine-monophosphate kinase